MPTTKLPEFSENTISNLLSLATKIKKLAWLQPWSSVSQHV